MGNTAAVHLAAGVQVEQGNPTPFADMRAALASRLARRVGHGVSQVLGCWILSVWIGPAFTDAARITAQRDRRAAQLKKIARNDEEMPHRRTVSQFGHTSAEMVDLGLPRVACLRQPNGWTIVVLLVLHRRMRAPRFQLMVG